MPIYTIRTTSGREDVVIDMLESSVRSGSLGILSIFHPAEIKGYVFVEGSLGAVQKGMHGLMHAKGLIEKPIRLEEIRHFLEQKKTMIRVSEGDTVEIIGGPFRGERGEIKRIDKVKDEVTIELLEASIPIPVTIATEFIKIVKKVKSEEIPEAAPPSREPEPAAEEAKEEEGSAFDLNSLKEREEARELKKAEAIEAEKKDAKKPFGELRKQMAEPEERQEVAKEPAPEAEDAESMKGGILEELEKEERAKKKKRMDDLEYVED